MSWSPTFPRGDRRAVEMRAVTDGMLRGGVPESLARAVVRRMFRDPRRVTLDPRLVVKRWRMVEALDLDPIPAADLLGFGVRPHEIRRARAECVDIHHRAD